MYSDCIINFQNDYWKDYIINNRVGVLDNLFYIEVFF